MAPPLPCVDLSANNAHADLAAAQAAGVRLVFLRGTIGLVQSARDIDGRCIERANECRRLGLDFGVYGDVFPRHGREQDAEKQALDLVKLHREVGATIVPAQDIEPEGYEASGAEWRVAVDAFADVLLCEAGGGISYGGIGFFEQYAELMDDTFLGKTLLWQAAYVDVMPAAFGPWKTSGVALWQRRGGGNGLADRFVGHCPGVVGACDMSEMLVGIDALRV